MTLWVDWLAAERARDLAQSNLQSVQASLAVVEKRRTAPATPRSWTLASPVPN